MMELIRTKSKGIVMWGIVALIISSFALFGVESYLSGASGAVPAVVNGVDISSSQLTRAVQSRKEQLQQQLGANYNPDLFPTDFLRQQVLNDLISRRLVNEFTQTVNMTASPKQVYEEIKEVPQFKDAKGNFSAKLYTRALKGAGRNKAAFEAEVAKDYILNQLRVGIFNSAFVLPYEVEQTQKLLNQQRKIGYLTFSKEKYKQKEDISEDELKKYYESHLALYKTEEKVNVEYVELNINQMASKIDISADNIDSYYKENISNYSEKDYPAALTMIRDVRKRINNGESFEQVGKTNLVEVGDLGFIRNGVQEKAFDVVAFRLKQGELSQPVKTSFGYQLIKVTEIKGEERKVEFVLVKPLEKQRKLNASLSAEIKKDLQRQEAEKSFFEQVEEFSNLAYENSDSLEAVAAGLGLDIKFSGLITRQGLKGVLRNSQIISAIYSDQVLNKNKNSEVIELTETHVIVVRIKEHLPATQKEFESVKAEVTKQVSIQHQIDAMKKDVNLAYKNLTAGDKGVDQTALFNTSVWTPAKFASRRTGRELKIPDSILRKAFTLARPAENKPSVAIVDLANGDQSIIVVSGVNDNANTNTAEAKSINQQLQQANTNTEYLGFEKYLKDNAEISINLSKDSEQNI